MQQHTQCMSSAHAPAQHRAGKAWQSQCERGYADGRSVCSMAWPSIAQQHMGWHIVVEVSISSECSMFDRALSESAQSRQQRGRVQCCAVTATTAAATLFPASVQGHVQCRRAVGHGKQVRGCSVKEVCKEAQFDLGRPARHGIIEMSRSGAFDVVQVATHVCSQGGV